MPIGRYVQVDETTHYITNGPFLWDGETEVDFGPGTVMLESEALEEGYEWPPPPEDPEDPDPEPEPESPDPEPGEQGQ